MEEKQGWIGMKEVSNADIKVNVKVKIDKMGRGQY